jgi:molecular chaperone DnaK
LTKDNTLLGKFQLDGIPAMPRGVPQIEVAFDIDANGILNVSAKDKGTGKEQKIRIEAGSGLTKEEIEKMKNEAKANETTDKEAREKIDKLNAADGLVFQTEKQLKEFGEKIPAEKKVVIENALTKLKDAHKMQDLDTIEASTKELNDAWMAASQDMYNATNPAGPQGAEQPSNDAGKAGAENVTDAEFEEVK